MIDKIDNFGIICFIQIQEWIILNGHKMGIGGSICGWGTAYSAHLNRYVQYKYTYAVLYVVISSW